MRKKTNKFLHDAIIQVVDNQLRDKTPPETQKTFDRLIAQGYEVLEAKRLIGCVVTSEFYNVQKNHEPFNPERFIQAVNRLPTPILVPDLKR
jgi:hypothetical protein